MTQASPRQTVRDCDGCTLCCKVIGVKALGKEMGVWCQHCSPGGGCAIYETRPDECRNFDCGYLLEPSLGPEWKPSESKIVLLTELGGRRIVAHVDTQRPDAWRREPFYSTLKMWAKDNAAVGGQVVVSIGPRRIAILPDRDVELKA
jgi:Fe-S-cluster containining protein